MTKTYNINTFGTLTNTDGVLSDFSTTNYATINSTITYTNSFELNFKVTTSSDVSNLQIICCPDVDQEGVRLDISGGKFELLCGKNGTWFNLANYQGGTVQANTTYWIRASYDGNNAYKLEVSTDGNNYSTVISFTSINKVTSNFTNYLLGIYSDFTLGIFKGSIDLNACSISTNNIRVWRGVVNNGVTIQLRRDTAINWAAVNPILAQGEVGLELDTGKQKIGDGSTAWNSLGYSLGSTALQKAGDTATGAITFGSDVNIQDDFNLIIPEVTKGTNPSSYTYKSMQFVDKNNSSTWYNSRLGIMEYTLGSNGDSYIAFGAYPNTSNSTDLSGLHVGFRNSQKFCEFPNTICVDGQWEAKNSNLVTSSSSTALPTTDDLTYDLSTYLPADASTYDYEVAIDGVIYTGSTNGDRSFLVLQGIFKEQICATIARSNASYRQGGFGILPISHTNRTLTIVKDANNTGTFSLNLRGYRRLGTNT